MDTDRIEGTLLGLAAGAALGAGYEFAHPPFGEIAMIGGGLGDFAPGECTDDTAMAICIAEHPRGAAGNGALMRTAPEALCHLGDDERITEARAVAALTHADPLAGGARGGRAHR